MTTARATKLAGVCAASLLIGISQTHATQTVRELWSGSGKPSLHGIGSNPTSVGFDNSTNWVVSPPGNTGLQMDGTWNLDDWMGIDGNTALPNSGGSGGTVAFYSGNMNSTLINPATSLPYGDFYSQCYATRALAPAGYINFKADATYYFSVRVFVGYADWSWLGSVSGGFGFASSGATNANFVGIGVSKDSPYFAADGTTDIGSTAYITTGTLDQVGTGYNVDITTGLDTDGGPYRSRAAGAANLHTNAVGLLVGRLTTTASGASTMEVKVYTAGAGPYPSDPSSITWDASYSFTETNVMTQLLVWQHGGNPSVQDALRVGTAWGDVIGLELIGTPKATPSSTVFAGTTVTLSQSAGLNNGTYPMSFQWRSNSVDILDATNATLVLSNPTTDFTANYSVVVSNFFGTLTSAATLVTINPAVAPYFVQQPQPVALTRYVGAPSATFSTVVDGTPPFTFQWKHAGTNIGSATTTAVVTNALTVGPITLADAGNYTVTVTNSFGTTNSASAVLTLIAPATNTYAAALLSLPTNPTNLFGYWRMDDNATTNDPTIRDYWNGQNGQVNVSDLSYGRFTFGADGVPYPTFAAPHLATALGTGPSGTNWQAPNGPYNNPWEVPYRMDLHNLPSAQTNMTFTMWVKGGVRLMARNNYGQGYGLQNQAGNIRFYWGAYNSTNGVRTATWDTGLTAPENEWAFVALVVEGTNAAVYVGSKTSFTSASSADVGGLYDPENGGNMTIVSSTTLGESNLRLAVGRNPYPWADDNTGAPWESTGGTWSDIGVLYQALTPGQVKGLFLAGNGLWIEGTPDGIGNLILNWLSGFTLQEADSVTGSWTDIGAATPPYPVTMTGSKYYRVKPVSF